MKLTILYTTMARRVIYTFCVILFLATCQIVLASYIVTTKPSPLFSIQTSQTYQETPLSVSHVDKFSIYDNVTNSNIASPSMSAEISETKRTAPENDTDGEIDVPTTNHQSFSTTTRGAEAQEILTAHNSVREGLHLAPLQWSEMLAQHATQWAKILHIRGCTMVHERDTPYGENLYLSWTTNTTQQTVLNTPTDVVARWASEASNYTYQDNSCAIGTQCGHYTQIVWSETQSVGCAVQTCTTNERVSNIWVCKYDPPGNIEHQSPY